MPTLDLELLRSFAAVVSHHSFAAAAVHLGRTQSAITQQMQRLQEQIGHPLFVKQGRQKRLTERGERLLNYAQHMLALNDEALRNLRQGRFEGNLRIGAPHDVAETLLPSLLAEVARTAPLLQLDIHIGRSPYLMTSLESGEVDMIISNRADPQSQFEGVVLRNSPTVWLCAASYVHDPAQPVPLIMADGPSIFRRIGHEALDAAGVAWTPRYMSSGLVGIKAALRAGLGVTARGVEQLDAGLKVLDAGDGMPRLPDLAYYLYVRSRVVNPVTRQVFETLKQHLRLPRTDMPA
ncbi:LysR substrate-binding domain-containing protein [Verminephrobacter eiseniae]|uniref:LysR substrate-binding domain-containing protein n=1 Tax=Verminephrobacter eiseniae TaxID=364317 RepID=UPI002238ECB5|nr:LysR substrate-binding domain-containing protein [Verminephrobacter eiseniae]MCW5231927.1 transcriptional regulator LrhA [Verminephrobacter eiseniae]MCW5293660.1 transcriptional regulator LrhA [Verminephrobacter eiseniae]MCW8184317.1 transcriptional regulator LrhA [Verminephrobacter eiseniae]MCW8225040.1 transcriptional regulator LrhA [Verminephrobacter eiseniae]MCW8233332.1 transcriptional regulator LrhA [Verminephrobacter eiseniae]